MAVPRGTERKPAPKKGEADAFVGSLETLRRVPWGALALIILALLLVTYFDANLQGQPTARPTAKETCGNGACGLGEDFLSCPQDCAPTIATEPAATAVPTLAPLSSIRLANEEGTFGVSGVPADTFFNGKLSETGVHWAIVHVNPYQPHRDEVRAFLSQGVNVAVRLKAAEAASAKAQLRNFAAEFGSGQGPYIKYYIIEGGDAGTVKAIREAILQGCTACKIVVEVDPLNLATAETLANACAGPCFDVLGFQFYDRDNTSLDAYKKMKEQAQAIQAMLQKDKLVAPIWLTGTAAYDGNVGNARFRRDDQQANALYKTLASALGNGLSKAFLANPAGCFDGEEAYFCGVFVLDASGARPAFTTFQTVAKNLDGATFVKEIPGPIPQTKALQFATPSGTAYAVWSDEFQQTFRSMALPVASNALHVIDVLTGENASLYVSNGFFSVTLKDDSLLVQELPA